ncbi:MAG: PhoH-like protein, partial [Pseudomonadota bacterium]
MPLPPAPTQRASRLTHTAFEAASTEEDTPTAVIQTASQAIIAEPTPVAQSQRAPRGRKATAATPQQLAKAPETASASHSPARTPAAQRSKRKSGPSKLFVLDTNVLMHDPMSLFRFEEHDVFLPMIVLEEL